MEFITFSEFVRRENTDVILHFIDQDLVGKRGKISIENLKVNRLLILLHELNKSIFNTSSDIRYLLSKNGISLSWYQYDMRFISLSELESYLERMIELHQQIITGKTIPLLSRWLSYHFDAADEINRRGNEFTFNDMVVSKFNPQTLSLEIRQRNNDWSIYSFPSVSELNSFIKKQLNY